ncbi:restriction endonuclease type II-like protein [Crucibulum laeve]|uniref:Restriction endonuclease type II-like protein n=1 Tax=Crucibulum laeve TaxID=68775 RepID=A0A5C3MLE6_9AGAR|nr:restriction endonuclease type II-like protein [Crucibulum laeve]
MSAVANAPPPVVVPASGNNIIVNPLQRGNPVLECIRNVGKEFGDIVADYQVGRTTGVLFLSLKYHRLHPEYIHTRIEKLGHSYSLRILLILCDITEHRDPIRELTKTCLINNVTVIVAFSSDEAGHYLSTFKQFEHKPPDMIKERVDKDYNSILRTTLTSISKVNKTDVETLRTSFGSFANISKATSDQLQNLPGFGQVKVRNIRNAFDKPVRNHATTSLSALASQSRTQQTSATTATTIGESSTSTILEPSQLRRLPRSPSPVWDIELDLDEPPVPNGRVSGPPAQGSTLSAQSPKVFDIDLDLN